MSMAKAKGVGEEDMEAQEMPSKHLIFPIMPLPQHFGDYGFDPHIDYFQALEETRKKKRETRFAAGALHFKQQRPISKEDSKKNKKNRKWWRNAFLFWKWKNGEGEPKPSRVTESSRHGEVPGQLYWIENGLDTPSRGNPMRSRPLGESLTPTQYLSLRELNIKSQNWISTSSMPIYMVN